MFSSRFWTRAVAFVLALWCVSSSAAAETFVFERKYAPAPMHNRDQIADEQFFWVEALNGGIRLAGQDALTGADASPRIAFAHGHYGAPYISPDYIVADSRDSSCGPLTGLIVYDRKTGEPLGSRCLTDPVITALAKGNTLTLVQNKCCGAHYFLSRFTLPGMRFAGESHPAFLTDFRDTFFFEDKIVGIRATDLAIASLDGEHVSTIALPSLNERGQCSGTNRILDTDSPRIALGSNCKIFIIDLKQQRLLQTFEQPPIEGWFTFSGNLAFMRPEQGSLPEEAKAFRHIWIFDLQSGRELAETDELEAGWIKAIGDRLLSSSYGSRDISVYRINQAAFSQSLAAAPENADSTPSGSQIRSQVAFAFCDVRPDLWGALYKRVCPDAELRERLTRTYLTAIGKLDPAYVKVVQNDQNRWQSEICRQNSANTKDHPYSDEDARKCLDMEVEKRLQFLETISTEPPDAPYRFSRVERALLYNMMGENEGPIYHANLNTLPSGRRDDLMDRALKRVFGSILPKSITLPDVSGSPTNQFMGTMWVDSFVPSLGTDRYLVDDGCKLRDCGIQGRMVIDMSSGETALATIAAPDSLNIWIKACISPELKEFSLALFRSESDKEAEAFHFGSFPRQPVQETITQTAC